VKDVTFARTYLIGEIGVVRSSVGRSSTIARIVRAVASGAMMASIAGTVAGILMSGSRAECSTIVASGIAGVLTSC
jgi:hypothetical protein